MLHSHRLQKSLLQDQTLHTTKTTGLKIKTTKKCHQGTSRPRPRPEDNITDCNSTNSADLCMPAMDRYMCNALNCGHYLFLNALIPKTQNSEYFRVSQLLINQCKYTNFLSISNMTKTLRVKSKYLMTYPWLVFTCQLKLHNNNGFGGHLHLGCWVDFRLDLRWHTCVSWALQQTAQYNKQ